MTQPAKITPAEAAQELLRRKRARQSLANYIEYVSGKTPARHMRFLCQKLERAMVTPEHRLLICEPPGHAKSFITSWHFPAYYLSKFPDHNVVTVSHTDAFAEQWGRRVRNLMLGTEHQTLFPNVTVSEDSRAAGRWDTSQGGSYYATGVGGAVTGRRANCVSGDTIVETTSGPICIKNIDISSAPCYVLSYDTSLRKTSDTPVYRRVLAVARRTTHERLRIRTVAGNTLEATGEHLVFTESGFHPAQTLNPGDVLLRAVRKSIQTPAVRSVKKGPRGQNQSVLQPFMCDQSKQRATWFCAAKSLFGMRDTPSIAAIRRTRTLGLFKAMPQRSTKKSMGWAAYDVRGTWPRLRGLFERICGRPSVKYWQILLDVVQKYRSQYRNVWATEPDLQTWPSNQGSDRKSVREISGTNTVSVATSSSDDSASRRKKMCSVYAEWRASCSPYQFSPDGQSATKFSDSLSAMPRKTPCGGAFKTESDIVSVVEKIREESVVYDIEVEDTHCFFANGILVHNCILIDDPIRGIEDADSSTVRENMWSWWAADLGTRLIPGGIIILIQTRWHLDDLAGRIIASESTGGEKWEKVILPAIAKNNDPLGRKPGEALWPEWQSVAALERIKRQPAMTPRVWESLYQQSPVADSGNIIQRAWFKLWRSKEPPTCKYILQSWDTAVSKKEKSAYSCCLTFGVFDEPETNMPALILLSRWRGRVEYHDLKAMARRLYHNYLDDRFDMPMSNPVKLSPDILVIEDESSGKALISEFSRAGISAFSFPARKYGNKDSRLQLSLDIMEAGRVYVPAIPPIFTQPRKFADEYLMSLAAYPASEARDDVDATSQAIIRLKTSGWIYQPEDKPPAPVWREYQPREPLYG